MSTQPNYDLDTFSLKGVSLAPGTIASGNVTKNGLSVDMSSTVGPVSAICSQGVVAGAPTSVTVTFQLEESSDESVWVAMDPRNSFSVSDNNVVGIAKATGRTLTFCRIVATSVFTDGTNPWTDIAGIIFAQKIHAPS